MLQVPYWRQNVGEGAIYDLLKESVNQGDDNNIIYMGCVRCSLTKRATKCEVDMFGLAYAACCLNECCIQLKTIPVCYRQRCYSFRHLEIMYNH